MHMKMNIQIFTNGIQDYNSLLIASLSNLRQVT